MFKTNIFKTVLVGLALLSLSTVFSTGRVAALAIPPPTFAVSGCGSDGSGHWVITTSIDFGCSGAQCASPQANSTGSQPTSGYCSTYHNAMVDLLFAIIKFISDGVGLIVIMSIIIAGIQYTFSRGEPQAVQAASKRIQSSVTALIIFIFAYALLNFIIPKGLFGQ